MTRSSRRFLEASRRYLLDDYLPKIAAALASLDEEDVWWRPNEASNAIGNLLLHLRGNVAQWVVGGVGGRPYERDRPHEFAARGAPSKREAFARLEAQLAEADEVLASLEEGALARPLTIQGHETDGLEAIYHVVEHFGMHTGQILYVAKLRSGETLRLDG